MKKGIIYFIIFLLLGSTGLAIFLISHNVKESSKEEKQYTNYKKENNDNKEESNNVSNIKLDNYKDYIYDASYEYNVTKDSYTTSFYNTYYVKDIIVPYININSNEANKANTEIKQVFDKAIDAFKEGIEDKLTYVEKCDYEKYIDNNIASVNLTLGIGATDVVHPDYYTYNFNLKDGRLLSYEDVYEMLGFTSDSIDKKVEEEITNIMKKELKGLKDPLTDSGDGEYYGVGTNFDTYNNESISNYHKSVDDKSLRYFISSDKKLNVIVKLIIPAGTGEFDTIIKVS